MHASCCKPMPCAPEMLRKGQQRYDLPTEKLTEHTGTAQLHTVVWHAGQFKGFFGADEARDTMGAQGRGVAQLIMKSS